MKHKHADLIHAWADGAQIQVKAQNLVWEDREKPVWAADREYRIKLIRNPDMYKYVRVETTIGHIAKWQSCSPAVANLHLTFDGETGELISAEVI